MDVKKINKLMIQWTNYPVHIELTSGMDKPPVLVDLKNNVVLLDINETLELNDHEITALAAHEAGHVVCGHFDDNGNVLKKRKDYNVVEHDGDEIVICQSAEIEADEFAIKTLGKQEYVSGFKSMIHRMASIYNVDYEEIMKGNKAAYPERFKKLGM